MDGLFQVFFFFFFNDTATTEIYTLSLHDALPIYAGHDGGPDAAAVHRHPAGHHRRDRKSTRLNSSHLVISYAVFCLKKKKKKNRRQFMIIETKTKPISVDTPASSHHITVSSRTHV